MIKENTNLDIIYYFLASPGKGTEAVREKNFLFLSLFTATLSILSSFIGDNLTSQTGIMHGSLSLRLLIKFLSFYFFLFAFSFLYNVIAELSGSRTGVTVLLALLGFSFLPALLKTPIAIICSGFNAEGFYSILRLLIIGWIAGLQIFFLKKIYGFSFFKTVALYLSPFLLMFFLISFSIIFLIIFFALNLSSIFFNF